MAFRIDVKVGVSVLVLVGGWVAKKFTKLMLFSTQLKLKFELSLAKIIKSTGLGTQGLQILILGQPIFKKKPDQRLCN